MPKCALRRPSEEEVLGWAGKKWEIDASLAASKHWEKVEESFECLRRYVPDGLQRVPPADAITALKRHYEQPASDEELGKLTESLKPQRLSAWVETPQVRAATVLRSITETLSNLSLKLVASTGQNLFYRLVGAEGQPSFVIGTCAPFYFHRPGDLEYELEAVLHLEEQVVLERRDSDRPVGPDVQRHLLYLAGSTAEVEWAQIRANPASFPLLHNCRGRGYSDLYWSLDKKPGLVSDVSKLRFGDYVIAWPPLSDGLKYRYNLEPTTCRPFHSAVGLYALRNLPSNTCRDFVRLFCTKWESMRKGFPEGDNARQTLLPLKQLRTLDGLPFIDSFRSAAGFVEAPAGGDRTALRQKGKCYTETQKDEFRLKIITRLRQYPGTSNTVLIEILGLPRSSFYKLELDKTAKNVLQEMTTEFRGVANKRLTARSDQIAADRRRQERNND